MIHFTCDGCGRPIDLEGELRYVVRLEVYAAFDAEDDQAESNRDHLQEINDILESVDDCENDQIGEEVFQQARYDLCGDCRQNFLKNPLGRINSRNVGFSSN